MGLAQSGCVLIQKSSRSGSSSTEDQGELLHRQTEEGRFGTSTSEVPGEDLHLRTTTAGSPHRRKRIKGWISIGKGSRRSTTSSEKRRRDLLRLQNRRISCYFEFSSLQSRVVSVRGWLNLGVFAYRNPDGENCKFR